MKCLVKKLDRCVQGHSEGSEFQFFLFLVPLCNQTSTLDLVITVLITRSSAKWATHCDLNISRYTTGILQCKMTNLVGSPSFFVMTTIR